MRRIQNERVRVTVRDARIFAFGDSLSDPGTIFRLSGGQFPPSPPYFNGRFSNGPVAVETLGASLGLATSPLTNFAIGGAKTGRDNVGDTAAFRLGGLLDQIDRFASTFGARGANPRALYFIWIGGDDFLSQPNVTSAAVGQAVENVRTAVTTLANLGAQNIVVVQNPNLGRTPVSLEAGLLTPLTSVTRDFNNRLQAALTSLERDSQERNANLNVILSDLFPVGEEIAQNPAQFGFSNVTSAYLQGLLPADPLADPNQFFFWDQLHPTTRGHSVFAETLRQDVIDGITDDITLIGTRQDNLLVGYAGNDRLVGLAGQDRLEGNSGRDTLLGGRGDDRLQGLRDSDVLAGGSGNDNLQGGSGRDRALGQAGQDALLGGNGIDILLGGSGNDILQGGSGTDTLFGQAGRDQLLGGNGIDFLSGGSGNDLLNGGGGCDLFTLRAQQGTDTIQDFDPDGDLLFLPSLTFAQLEIRQQGSNTVIRVADDNQRLAILEDVRASSIDITDFLGARSDRTVLDLADRLEGAALLDAIQAELTGLKNLLQIPRG
ncbi:MAG: SGNH/GDSL hydrolase family protein [Elainella sp.]